MLILRDGNAGSTDTKEQIMNTSLRKSLAGAALVAAIVVGGAGGASAEITGTTVTVPPGGKSCVATVGRAGFKVRADGSAPNAVGATTQFSMANSYDGVTFQNIASQTSNGNYYGGELSYNLYPQYFPTYWRFCVRNQSTTTNAKVTLTLKTDYNAL